MKCIVRVFGRCEIVAVSERYFIIKGIYHRSSPVPAEQMMARMRTQHLKKLVKAGEVTVRASNVFTQKLAEDPMFSACGRFLRHDPMRDRVWWRRCDPRKTHGDVEPGCPGVSMKREQKRMKSKSFEIRQLQYQSIPWQSGF